MLGSSLVRGLLATVVVVAALALLAVAAVWLLLILLAAGGVLWLNLLILPRLSRRLGLPRVALEVVLLLALGAMGWLLGGTSGLALAGLAWLVGIGLPRLGGAWLRSRLRIVGWTASRAEPTTRLGGRACPRCGLVSFAASDRCRRCGAPLEPEEPARPTLSDSRFD
jgi:hypothetical protein